MDGRADLKNKRLGSVYYCPAWMELSPPPQVLKSYFENTTKPATLFSVQDTISLSYAIFLLPKFSSQYMNTRVKNKNWKREKMEKGTALSTEREGTMADKTSTSLSNF